MICEHCGCFFCADDRGDYPPDRLVARRLYCSHICAKRAGAKRNKGVSGGRQLARRREVVRQMTVANAKTCPRKQRYPSRDAAYAALNRKGWAGTPYECLACGSWHVTTTPLQRTGT